MGATRSGAELALLRATDLFAALDDATLSLLEGGVEGLQLAPGEILMRQGEEAVRLFVILRGKLVVLLQADDGSEQILAELRAGDVVGEIAVHSGGPRSATVRCLEKSDVIGVSRDALQRLLDAHPEALTDFLDGIRQRLNSTRLAVHLGSLLKSPDPDMLREFEAAAEWACLRSGEFLFRQGDAADAAYVVISGRLRVVVKGESGERVISELGRGEPVGEMALLDGGERSATVYAIRDAELARFSEAAFHRLIEKYPLATKQIASFVVRRLRTQLSGSGQPDSGIATIALVPTDPRVGVAEVARSLATALAAHGSVCHLSRREIKAAFGKGNVADAPRDEPAGMCLTHWLGDRESGSRFVLYETDARNSGWTDRALGQADHVLIVANAEADPAPGAIERRMAKRWPGAHAPRRSLLLMHRDADCQPTGTARWLRTRDVDAHYHLAGKAPAEFARLARLLAGRSVGLVLGGGGARGFAHIGVLRALEEVGVPVDLVGGTSSGAIIAGGRAMGLSSQVVLSRCKEQFASIFDPTLPLVALLAGQRIGAELRSGFGEREIEDLRIPFFCVSTNLTEGEETVHRSGLLARAIRASISIPGILPPVVADGNLLIDGGLLNNVPADVMADLCMGGPVISVDVAPDLELDGSYTCDPEVSGWKVLWDRVRPFRPAPSVPSIFNLLARTSVVASTVANRRRPLKGEGNLGLKISAGDWKLFEFGSVEAIAQSGYEASIDAIRSWWARESGRTA